MEMQQTKPHFSLPSLIALGAAIASFFVGAGTGFLLAMVAIGFGVLGFILALLPGVRGGLVSILSLGLAVLAIVVAIAKAFVG